MRNINQFDLPSKSYPNDDQVKLIPAFLNKFARSRDVNYLFKFANKISKESSISEKNKKWVEWYSKYQKSCDFVKNEKHYDHLVENIKEIKSMKNFLNGTF